MKIRDLLKDESRWTKDTMARDESGHPVTAESLTACRWCLSGAVLHCYRGGSARGLVLDLLEDTLSTAITTWNDADDRTFDDVRELVTRLDI